MPTRRIPSLNWLRVFEAAARTQSFSRAAEQLGMSTAAVSQQIKALETHFKKALFIRQSPGIRLTSAGQAFLPIVQQSLGALEVTAAGLFGNPEREPLSIQVALIFANSWLASRVGDFQVKYPHIHLYLSTYNDYQELQSLNYDLQIAFGTGPQYGAEGDPLFGESVYPVALPRISREIACIKDLLKFRLIEISEHHTGWVQFFHRLEDVSISDAEFLFTDNTTTAYCMATSGIGIALARAPASDELYARLGLEPCLNDIAIPGSQNYYLTYPSLNSLSSAARAFRAWILDQSSVIDK